MSPLHDRLTRMPRTPISKAAHPRAYPLLWGGTASANLADGITLAAAPLLAAALTRDPALVVGTRGRAAAAVVLLRAVLGRDRRPLRSAHAAGARQCAAVRRARRGDARAGVRGARAVDPVRRGVPGRHRGDGRRQRVAGDPAVAGPPRPHVGCERPPLRDPIDLERAGRAAARRVDLLAVGGGVVRDRERGVPARCRRVLLCCHAWCDPPTRRSRRTRRCSRRCARGCSGSARASFWSPSRPSAGVINFSTAAVLAILVLFTQDRLGLDDAGYGLLLAVEALGGIPAGLLGVGDHPAGWARRRS